MEEITITRRYTALEREELIEQWQQSGKNKTAFCKERSLSYYSFNDWIKQTTLCELFVFITTSSFSNCRP